MGLDDLPWAPRSRSKEGNKTEKHIVKKRGGVPHPRSGAGRIKDDGHNEDTVFEVKDAKRTHAINGSDLLRLFKRASQQGKTGEYIIYFADADITLTGRITKGKG